MDYSILPIAATVMGGMGTLVGPVLGAFILTPLSEALRGFGQMRVVLYCLIFIGFIVYKPEGIDELPSAKIPSIRTLERGLRMERRKLSSVRQGHQILWRRHGRPGDEL